MRLLILFFAVFLFAQSRYCNDLSDKRNTIIYIDLSSVYDKKFPSKFVKILRGTFLPHERVKIYFINPQTSEVDEVFNSCVPKLSKKEILKIKKEGGLYLFGGNPIDQANEDLMFFYSNLKNIFKKALSKRVESDEKPLVEIFYNEEDKFTNPLNRLIIYSDMLQNSEDIPLNKLLAFKADDVKEYKVNYNYANTYVLLPKKPLKGSEFLKLKKFWHCYYENNKANLNNFNTTIDLKKFNGYYVRKYKGSMKYSDGSEFKIRILVVYDNKGNILNGWFIINGIDDVPLKGKVFLKKNKVKKMKLKVYNLCKNHYLINGEKINLKFKGNMAKGELIIDNTKTIVKTPKGNIIENPKVVIELKEEE
jgi:hypothetical protein